MSIFSRIVERLFSLAAAGSALLTIAVFLLLLYLALPLFEQGGFWALIRSPWDPGAGLYGIYPMLIGSLSIAFLALLIGFPLSLGGAFFITCFAPLFLRRHLLNLVRLLTGVPTVVYSFAALFLLVPFLREHLTGGSGLNILGAALMLAVLIAPTMIIFFVDALRRVPSGYLQAVTALGGSPGQGLVYIALPLAWPGILNGLLLGLGRAMGDTMISLMIAGNAVALPGSMMDSARTLTAHIALVIAADVSSLEFQSIFACGILLYLFTALLVLMVRLLGKFPKRSPG
ncbi:MAG: ABC transporter permease subunit [Desulfuromonadaceae bacterium]|nr:ABC transporter permease subunit [Desulfuromonadaceae bacterium]